MLERFLRRQKEPSDMNNQLGQDRVVVGDRYYYARVGGQVQQVPAEPNLSIFGTMAPRPEPQPVVEEQINPYTDNTGHIKGVSARIQSVPISCGILAIYNIWSLPSELPRLLFFSKYPFLLGPKFQHFKLHSNGQIAEYMALRKNFSYLMSTRTNQLEPIRDFIEKHDLGTFTYTHQHHNGNYLDENGQGSGLGYTIGVLYWTWNGNIISMKDVPNFPYNDDGSPKASTLK